MTAGPWIIGVLGLVFVAVALGLFAIAIVWFQLISED